jgi:hypothetical protein
MGDSIPDLFVTMRDEEIVSGVLLVGTPAGATTAFETNPAETCRIPELRIDTASTRVSIVEHLVGAVTRDECAGDVTAAPCIATYPVEWLRLRVFDRRGKETRDSGAARQFYAKQSGVYARGEQELRRALAAGHPPSSRCDRRMADSLHAMAVRAGVFARPARST